MRKTIYVPSEEVWDRIKLIAEQGGMSVSGLILAQFEGSEFKVGSESQLDRIEGKLDAIKFFLDRTLDVELEDLSKLRQFGVDKPAEKVPNDMEMLVKKQAEIDSIKARKIAKVKDNIRPDAEVVGDVVNQMGQIRRQMPKGGK